MRRSTLRFAPLAAVACAALWLGVAGRAQDAPRAPDPPTLSEWGQLFIEDGRLRLAEGVVPYALNTALFTDYAHKLRTISLPAGTAAAWNGEDVLEFPVGTVITKTFYYPRVPAEPADGPGVARAPDLSDDLENGALDLSRFRLIETRVLVRRESGWVALPYLWNEAQTEASLARIGAIERLELVSAEGARAPFAYVVPNQNQCAACHAITPNSRALSLLGPRPRNLDRDFAYVEGSENQLDHLARLGLLSASADAPSTPPAVDFFDAEASVEARARAYLDVNCAHCHSETGPADTSGLHLGLNAPAGPHLGICKPPIAAGSGSGGRRFSIVPGEPDASILLFRMESTDPGAMMPELGRSTVHDEGVALVRDWIAGLDGGCG